MSSTFGTIFTVTTFGESHCKGVGAVVDGCPPRLALSEADIQPQLDRRRPVLVLTRSIDMHCYLEAMQMGAIDYVEKPVPPADLLRFVQAHIANVESRINETSA